VIDDNGLVDQILGRSLLASIGLNLNHQPLDLSKENLVLNCIREAPKYKDNISMLISHRSELELLPSHL
jgi:hypothetical protein